MTGDLILLTGATGFLGHRVLIQSLEAGYRVRCAVRSAEGIEKMLSSKSFNDLGLLSQNLSWIVVPDITATGAYDQAVVDVRYIIHVASPAKDGRVWGQRGISDEEYFVKPASMGVLGILESAAAHSPTLKRIVVTSSIVAVTPVSYFQGLSGPEIEAPNAESRIEDLTPPYPPGFAYQASKIAALNASEVWMKKHNPKFDMINILPGWIWGHQELATSADDLLAGSNSHLLSVLGATEKPYHIHSSVVSIHDCANAHLLALDPKVERNQAFIVGQLENLEQASTIAHSYVPEAFTKGIFSNTTKQPIVKFPQDGSKTRIALGLELRPFEEVVKEVASQYWELSNKN
ncbi:hypothetical protein ACHAPJ_007452 [Fusarium lateritium]